MPSASATPASSTSPDMRGRRRGGGWVWLQFAVMAALLGVGFLPPEWPNGAQRILSIVGLVLVVAGGGIAVWAARLLGRGFTPYPRPLASGELIDRGQIGRAHV